MDKQCTYCKRFYGLIEKDGAYFLPGHAKNPKKPVFGHCEGAGMEVPIDWVIKKLHNSVFTFQSSDADEKYFRAELFKWIKNEDDTRSLEKILYHISWIRNDEGKTVKYMYFNERSQKVFLDHNFLLWAKCVVSLIKKEFEIS
jgi:hypothetical protein